MRLASQRRFWITERRNERVCLRLGGDNSNATPNNFRKEFCVRCINEQQKVKMKVKDLIEQLSAYDKETELVVAYWDKETVEGFSTLSLSETQWSLVVDDSESGEWNWQSSAGETLIEIAEKVVGDE